MNEHFLDEVMYRICRRDIESRRFSFTNETGDMTQLHTKYLLKTSFCTNEIKNTCHFIKRTLIMAMAAFGGIGVMTTSLEN